jgi:hypothetical protein
MVESYTCWLPRALWYTASVKRYCSTGPELQKEEAVKYTYRRDGRKNSY